MAHVNYVQLNMAKKSERNSKRASREIQREKCCESKIVMLWKGNQKQQITSSTIGTVLCSQPFLIKSQFACSFRIFNFILNLFFILFFHLNVNAIMKVIEVETEEK